MNCCNANGECTQGRDCPIRKQRIKEINDAYMNAQIPSLNRIWDNKEDQVWDDPYIDTISTFKALIAVIAVTGAVTLLAYVIWGK